MNKINFFEKNILPEGKKVVLLHPFSARGNDDRKQEKFEMMRR